MKTKLFSNPSWLSLLVISGMILSLLFIVIDFLSVVSGSTLILWGILLFHRKIASFVIQTFLIGIRVFFLLLFLNLFFF